MVVVSYEGLGFDCVCSGVGLMRLLGLLECNTHHDNLFHARDNGRSITNNTAMQFVNIVDFVQGENKDNR